MITVDPKHQMTFHDWQLERRALQETEFKERQGNIEAARAHIQVAITEQAIRKLYSMVNTLADRVEALEKIRSK